jgi:putative membrane protein
VSAVSASAWEGVAARSVGSYHYTGATAGREVFISNVPFFDPLSFPFLAYASFCLARGALRKPDGWAVSALAGTLMLLLDVVIDPLAVRGDRWFLGRVFYYAEPGVFFGVVALVSTTGCSVSTSGWQAG